MEAPSEDVEEEDQDATGGYTFVLEKATLETAKIGKGYAVKLRRPRQFHKTTR